MEQTIREIQHDFERIVGESEIDIIGFKDESHPYGAILKKRVNIL